MNKKYYRWGIIGYGSFLALSMVSFGILMFKEILPNPFTFNLLTLLVLCIVAIQTLAFFGEKAEEFK